MGDKKFTFIEFHLDGETQFGPSMISDALPIGGTDTATETETAIETDDDEAEAETEAADDDSGSKAIGALVALVVLVGLGIAVKKYTGGDDEVEQETEPDVIVD